MLLNAFSALTLVAGSPSGLPSRSMNRASFLNAAHEDISKNTLESDHRNQFLNTSLRDPFMSPHSPQQNPGHTPNAGIGSPLRTVNTDVSRTSSNLAKLDLGTRPKSSVLRPATAQLSYQDGMSNPSVSPVSLGRGINTSYVHYLCKCSLVFLILAMHILFQIRW